MQEKVIMLKLFLFFLQYGGASHFLTPAGGCFPAQYVQGF